VFRAEFDARKATRLACHGSEVFDSAIHAARHVDYVANLDVVDGRHIFDAKIKNDAARQGESGFDERSRGSCCSGRGVKKRGWQSGELNSRIAGPNVDHGRRATSIDTQRLKERKGKKMRDAEPCTQDTTGICTQGGQKGGCGTTINQYLLFHSVT
jgi:hypothetical protein